MMDKTIPKGAEIRFAAYVEAEIMSGNFIAQEQFFSGDLAIVSPNRPELRIGEEVDWDNTFSLCVYKTWFGYGKPKVYLQRGDNYLDLWPEEETRLAETYFWALRETKKREKQAEEEQEAKRQRAAWWP